MSIFNTPEKDISNFEGEYDTRRVRKSSVKSSSTLSSCSICAMYNRVNCTKIRIVLKSYIPGINSFIVLKRHYYIFSSENTVNELRYWIEKHPHVIR